MEVGCLSLCAIVVEWKLSSTDPEKDSPVKVCCLSLYVIVVEEDVDPHQTSQQAHTFLLLEHAHAFARRAKHKATIFPAEQP